MMRVSSSCPGDEADSRGVREAALRPAGLELICKVRDAVSLSWAGVLLGIMVE